MKIPGPIAIGAIEILSGALVWVLPFDEAKPVGGAMILDGIRRILSCLEETVEEKLQEASGANLKITNSKG